jgi:mRNA deadenylase 3'-5' endonuclease subunit Ccr4
VYKDSDKFVSTFQNQWILVDYMFYTNSKNSSTNNKNNSQLTLLEYLTLPSSEECEKIRLKIPNDFLGSDHLSLAARFHISTQSNYPTKL